MFHQPNLAGFTLDYPGISHDLQAFLSFRKGV